MTACDLAPRAIAHRHSWSAPALATCTALLLGVGAALAMPTSRAHAAGASNAEVPVYGAQPDLGATDDPRTDAVRYAGQVYYVSCTHGDDSNDGRSPASAWKTLAAVNQRTEVGYWDLPGSVPPGKPRARGVRISAPSGSAFLFERGCSFEGYINVHAIVPVKGKVSFTENITFGAYGDRSKLRPLIETRSAGPDYHATIWSNGHTVHVRNLHLVGSEQAPGAGVWLRASVGSSVENTLIENMQADGVHAGESQDLVVRNSEFRNNQLSGRPGGGLTGSGKNMRVEHNSFVDNGRNRILAHNIYLSSLHDAVIEANRIEGGSNLGIVLHGTCDGVRIVGNDIFGNSNGIDISGGYPTQAESFNNMLIERNRIHHNGMRPNEQGYGLLLKSVSNSAIRNNLVYLNRISPLSLVDRNEGDAGSSKLVIEHNLLQSPSLGISFAGTQIAEVALRDNIIAVGGDNFAINKAPNVPDTALLLDGNVYHAPRIAERRLIRWGTVDLSPGMLAGSLGQEMHGMVADPMFVNPQSGDFSLQPGSPARQAGVTAGVGLDFAASPSTRTAPPSTGSSN